MPTIFDSAGDNTLGSSLLKTFPAHQRLDVATGYLDLRGWSSFSDLVDEKCPAEGSPKQAVARVLVGMVTPSAAQAMLDELQDQVQPPAPYAHIPDFESARKRQTQVVAHLREQLMRGLSTTEGQASLRSLKQQLPISKLI